MRLTLAQAQAGGNSAKLNSAESVAMQAKEITRELTSAINSLDKMVNENVEAIQETVDDIQDDNEVPKGIVHRHSVKLQQMNDKVVNLTARSMQNNVTISGLKGDSKDEIPRNMVVKFFQDVMNLPVDPRDILVAHREGKPVTGVRRLMIIRCIPDLKQKNTSKCEITQGY